MDLSEIIKLLFTAVPMVVAVVKYFKNSRSDTLRNALNQAFDFAEGLGRSGVLKTQQEKFEAYLKMARDLAKGLGLGQLTKQEVQAAEAWAKMRAGAAKPLLNGVNKHP